MKGTLGAWNGKFEEYMRLLIGGIKEVDRSKRKEWKR